MLGLPNKIINMLGTSLLGRSRSATLLFKVHYGSRFVEVGKMQPAKTENYEVGQIFLHKIFGYRGVILFPWNARVFDRDVFNKNTNDPDPSSPNSCPQNESESQNSTIEPCPEGPVTWNLTWQKPFGQLDQTTEIKDADLDSQSLSGAAGKEVKSKTHTYYQVLIDSRDGPFIRAQTEGVTFLGNHDNARSLYAIPGLDYVAHEDIFPYLSTEKVPLQHELFEKFLIHQPDKDPPFQPKETLLAWQQKNHPWLELSDVHKETTENVRVTVIPFYMGCRDSQNSSVYWWRYCIRLENLGEMSVQLRERHWRIFSLSGLLETVRGRGVVGKEPVLTITQPYFQYSSHVSLQAPSGHMWGTFRMEREDGYTFDCRIPPFCLESKGEDTTTTDPSSSSE